MGRGEEALGIVNDVLTQIERTGEKRELAEMLRIKGEMAQLRAIASRITSITTAGAVTIGMWSIGCDRTRERIRSLEFPQGDGGSVGANVRNPRLVCDRKRSRRPS
jgi:hypothetical protein